MPTPDLSCPRCRSRLLPIDEPPGARCSACELDYGLVEGIWRLLPPERLAHHAQFIREYEAVRAAEGRHKADPQALLALPYRDLTGQRAEEWRMRSVSLDALIAQVLERLQARRPRPPLRVLDLGSGNGWLSYRLARRGHPVVAVDLLTHAADGLGAHRSYEVPFTSVQAEFEHLPFPDGSFDVAVFNGSVHYSRDYRRVLREVLRLLQPEGRLVVMDSPIYHQAQSGQSMVRERQDHFLRTLGFASDALPQEGYLTFERLEQLGDELSLRWELVEPFYGWRWTLRPLKARLLGRREPAKFILLVGARAGALPLQADAGTGERLLQQVRRRLWPLRRATWL